MWSVAALVLPRSAAGSLGEGVILEGKDAGNMQKVNDLAPLPPPI